MQTLKKHTLKDPDQIKLLIKDATSSKLVIKTCPIVSFYVHFYPPSYSES
jgi:hypothetical protein